MSVTLGVLVRWRVGREVSRTVYCCDSLVGMMDTPELAREVVDAMNRAEQEGCKNPDCPIDCPPSHCYPLPPGPEQFDEPAASDSVAEQLYVLGHFGREKVGDCGCGRPLYGAFTVEGTRIGVTHSQTDEEHHLAYFAGGNPIVEDRRSEHGP